MGPESAGGTKRLEASGVATGGQRDRALGCLLGMAAGDAMGMATQMMPVAAVRARFGHVAGFASPPEENWIARGEAPGTVTDDTEQAFVIIDALAQAHEEGRDFDWSYLSSLVANGLVQWAANNRRKGQDFLGPSSRAAIAAIERGESIESAGRWGDTNGASMRIPPVGIACRPGARLLDVVEAVSLPTHHTGLAMSGAALVATVVSEALDGVDLAACIARGVEAAEAAYGRGHYVAGALVASRTRRAVALADSVDHGDEDAVQRVVAQVADEIGTGVQTQEAVPAAVGFLCLRDGDPWRTIVDATNAGGDSDTIAAIAGAMGGALTGSAVFPAQVVAQLEAVNHLHLADQADRLLRIRQSS